MEVSADNRQDFGKMEYGCEHYRRRCKIRAPCCDKVFPCRHCHNQARPRGQPNPKLGLGNPILGAGPGHNEATSMLENPKERHEIQRTEVKQVICSVCSSEQQVGRICSNCGVNMGEYFCDICKFYDDDTEKGQFHCNGCGICRVGGRENFFHCQKCGSCYAVHLRDNHVCVENSMKNHCPICYEYLFDSLKKTQVMSCGHTIHIDCFSEMQMHNKYTCPVCSKSVIDMSSIWRGLDTEVEATAMPEEYRDKKVGILCNDCNTTSEVFFHILGMKCSQCSSYNTRRI